MKLKIIGSGGCVSLPRPLCSCHVCQEAREKKGPYIRRGCSLLIEDHHLLIDTPEDIGVALNEQGIVRIEGLLYSHLDPDHVMGLRLIEQLKLDWFKQDQGCRPKDPLPVYARAQVMEDLQSLGSNLGSFMAYYEEARGLIERRIVDKIRLGSLEIHLIGVGRSTIFVMKEADKKVIYAPCDCKPFPDKDLFYESDLLILGNTYPEGPLKNNQFIHSQGMIAKDLFSYQEALALLSRFKIKKILFTHLEEDWGKSYEDYKKMETEQVQYAYDGMEISL